MTTHKGLDEEELLVHNWRVDRLTRLGVPGSLAEVYADRLDWHQVARLVQRGWPPAAGPAHRPVMSGPVRWPVWDEGLWLPGTDSPCFPDRRRRWSTANSRGLRPVPCRAPHQREGARGRRLAEQPHGPWPRRCAR